MHTDTACGIANAKRQILRFAQDDAIRRDLRYSHSRSSRSLLVTRFAQNIFFRCVSVLTVASCELYGLRHAEIFAMPVPHKWRVHTSQFIT